MIWVRADANKEIGTGHVMRCLSVAEQLKKRGLQVKFLLADKQAAALLESRNQSYEILHTDYRSMEEEGPLLCRLMERDKPTLCLVDSYFVTASYLEELGNICPTAYMDDLFSFAYPVDMVINYNIYGDILPYREQPGKENTQFLLGTDYVPLREEFVVDRAAVVREEAQNVLITTGGSDPHNLAGRIVERGLHTSETASLHYHVVSGVFNTHLLKLQKIAAEHPNVFIHSNVTDMKQLMEQSDIAISAGGSTMYELCAVGVPIICFSFVENQEQIVETFARREIVGYAGNYRLIQDDIIDNIIQQLKGFLKDRALRQNHSRAEQRLVDGLGAERIAEALCKCAGRTENAV